MGEELHNLKEQITNTICIYYTLLLNNDWRLENEIGAIIYLHTYQPSLRKKRKEKATPTITHTTNYITLLTCLRVIKKWFK